MSHSITVAPARKHSLITQDDVDGYAVITSEDYRKQTEHHPELKGCTGYSVFEIEMPDQDLNYLSTDPK